MATTATTPKTEKAPAKPRAKKPAPAGQQGKSASGQILMLKISQIVVRDGFNPRNAIEQERLGELAQSLRARGILTPCLVRPGAANGKYFLLGGHRRLAAAELAAIDEIPCVVRDEASELEDAVADNFNRADLNPLEEAHAFDRLVKEKGLTAKGVAEAVGVAQRRVTERLRILDTPKDLHEHFGTGKLSAQAAKPLAEIAEFDQRLAKLAGQYAASENSGRSFGNDWFSTAYWVVENGPGKKGDLTAVDLGHGYYRSGVEIKALGTLSADVKAKVDRLDAEGRKNYGPGYRVALDDAAIDALNAAGVMLVEPNEGRVGRRAIVKDRAVLREVCLPIIDRDLAALIKTSADARRGKGKSAGASAAAADEAAKEYAQTLESRGYNLRLGDALMKNFASVPFSLEAAKFICRAALAGGDGSTTKVASLASRGLRYVLPQWQDEIHRKNGKVKVRYPSLRNHMAVTEKKANEVHPADCSLDSLFWQWWDLAATPEEVLGRTIVAFGAAAHADTRAVPHSQRMGSSPIDPGYSYGGSDKTSPKALAREGLTAIVGKKIPAKGSARPRATNAKSASKGASSSDDAPSGPSFADLENVHGPQLVAWVNAGTISGAHGAPTVDQYLAADRREAERPTNPHAPLDYVPPTKALIKAALDEAFEKGFLGGAKISPNVTEKGKLALAGAGHRPGPTTGDPAAEPAVVVHVRGAVDTSELVEAELCPDEPPAGRDVRKVIYTSSRTAAWVATSRIVYLDDKPELTDLQLRVLRYFRAGGTKVALKTETDYRKAFKTTSGAAGSAVATLLSKDLLGGDQFAPFITKRAGELLDAMGSPAKAAA